MKLWLKLSQRWDNLSDTSASIKMYKGIDIKAVSKMQGTSLKLLLELYDHVYDEARRESANIFNDLIGTTAENITFVHD